MSRFDIGTKAGVDAFIDEYIDVVNSLSVGRYLEICHDDITWVDPSLPEPARGKEAVGAFIGGAVEAFPGLRLVEPDPSHRTFYGNQVAWAWIMQATVEDKAMEMHGVELFEIRDGLLAMVRSYNYIPFGDTAIVAGGPAGIDANA